MVNQVETTRIVADLARGRNAGAATLIPLVYDELRALAERCLAHERVSHTLQPTALVNEVYLRMVDAESVDWRGRAHFLALAAGQIRHILVDHARKRAAAKRGGGYACRVSLGDLAARQAPDPLDVLALHDALERLEGRSPRQARVVELRYFAGLSVEETAEVMSLSKTTIKDEWTVARAWLHRALRGDAER
jgi:RNA polymerase sigma factor (TIGR02999 family)